MIEFIRTSIPAIVVVGQLLAAVMLISYLARNSAPRLLGFFKTHALSIAFLYAAISLSGSLFYSDILGYEPCKLCWWQRIFMYPQVLLFFIAMLRRDNLIYRYSIPLSAIGLFVAVNHYILQLTGTSILPCSAVGYSVSCSKVFILSYGYMTIPLMAATGFAGIILASLFLLPRKS